MSVEDNKAIVGRWFTEFWGETFNPAIIDELAAPDMRFEYSLHAPVRGREAIREFAVTFRAAFPDLGFEGTAGLIAEEIGLDDGVTVLRQLGLLTGSTGP